MKTTLKPRHARNRANGRFIFDTFLGYACDLDVYAHEIEGDDNYGNYTIVCSQQAAKDKTSIYKPYNWDIICLNENGNVVNLDNDVDTPLPTLVEIYRIIAEHRANCTGSAGHS